MKSQHQSPNCQQDHLSDPKVALLHSPELITADSTHMTNILNPSLHQGQISVDPLHSKVQPPSTENRHHQTRVRFLSRATLVAFVVISDQPTESMSIQTTRMCLVIHRTIRLSTAVAQIALTVLDPSAQPHLMEANLAEQQQTAEKDPLHHHQAEQRSPRHHLQ